MTSVLDRDFVDRVLRASHTIAVVGLSRNPAKASYGVAHYMRRHGYRILPINPFADEILDETCYPTLGDVPPSLAAEIDIVDIFRPSKDLPEVVQDVLDHVPGVALIWAQLGISNEQAAEKARAAGVPMVQDICIKVEHGRLASRGSVSG